MNNINLIAPINSLGYGQVGYNICTELSKNINVCLFPITNIQLSNAYIDTALKNAEMPIDGPCIRLWHQHQMDLWAGSPRIGWPIFELDKFSDREKHNLMVPDRLFVCSKWAAEIVKKEIGREADVIPLGVDTEIFHPQVRYKNEKTVFINVGKWEVRKGHDILVDMFNAAFTPQDSVELWMLNHNPFCSEEEHKNWVNLYRSSPLGYKIRILPRQTTQQQLAKIMNSADCGVFPSKAEGWNLELLEMMALDKPVITTNYSAHTEFCDSANSFLVDIKETEPAYDGKWFFKQGNWAKIGKSEFDQFVEYMRYVHKNQIYKNMHGLATANHYQWSNSAKLILEKLT